MMYTNHIEQNESKKRSQLLVIPSYTFAPTTNDDLDALNHTYSTIMYKAKDLKKEFSATNAFVHDIEQFMYTNAMEQVMISGFYTANFVAINSINPVPTKYDWLVEHTSRISTVQLTRVEKIMRNLITKKEMNAESFSGVFLQNLFTPNSLQYDQKRILDYRTMILKLSVQSLKRFLEELMTRMNVEKMKFHEKNALLMLVTQAKRITQKCEKKVGM